MFTCRDGKGGELSSRASKMLYKPRHIRNGSTNQIAGNSLFSSENILKLDGDKELARAVDVVREQRELTF